MMAQNELVTSSSDPLCDPGLGLHWPENLRFPEHIMPPVENHEHMIDGYYACPEEGCNRWYRTPGERKLDSFYC
jgi:hypothetical protein